MPISADNSGQQNFRPIRDFDSPKKTVKQVETFGKSLRPDLNGPA